MRSGKHMNDYTEEEYHIYLIDDMKKVGGLSGIISLSRAALKGIAYQWTFIGLGQAAEQMNAMSFKVRKKKYCIL